MAKVATVGCGAMGSACAALMASHGHEVHAVTLRADHAEAMARHGMRVKGGSGDAPYGCARLRRPTVSARATW